ASPLACARGSAARDDVVRALDQLAHAAAVLVLIAEAVGGLVVDHHGAAAHRGLPRVRPAARGVDPLVADTQRRPLVHHHVGRADDRRTDARVRARGAAVRVRGHVRFVAESSLRGHGAPQVNPPGVMVPTPPTTGPTGTYGGANVGTGPVPSTLVTIVETFHRL